MKPPSEDRRDYGYLIAKIEGFQQSLEEIAVSMREERKSIWTEISAIKTTCAQTHRVISNRSSGANGDFRVQIMWKVGLWGLAALCTPILYSIGHKIAERLVM